MSDPRDEAAWMALWREMCQVAAEVFDDPEFRARADRLAPPPDLPALGAWLLGPDGAMGVVVLAMLRERVLFDTPAGAPDEAMHLPRRLAASLAALGVDVATRDQVEAHARRAVGGDVDEPWD